MAGSCWKVSPASVEHSLKRSFTVVRVIGSSEYTAKMLLAIKAINKIVFIFSKNCFKFVL